MFCVFRVTPRRYTLSEIVKLVLFVLEKYKELEATVINAMWRTHNSEIRHIVIIGIL